MNFTFGISHSQRKPFGFPLNMPLNMQTRQFSSYGLPSKKIDDLISKTGQFNVFSGPIVSNKCFSNPNFVNKNHPHILAPSVAGIVKFDTPSQNFCSTQICEKNVPKNETEMHIIENKLPEKPSQEEETMEVEKIVAEPKLQKKFVDKCLSSPKMSRKNKCKKQHKNKQHHKGNKSHKNKNKKSNSKKSKPWHKTNLDQEIMEFSESTLDSDSSNMLDDSVQPFCITVNCKTVPTKPPCIKVSPNQSIKDPVPVCINIISKTSPIDIKSESLFQNIDKSDSSMSISPCHHELLKSLTNNCISKLEFSPCSPRRIGRLPSECESEDSFIVFENDCVGSSGDMSTDDSDFEDDDCSVSDEIDCDVEFSDKCDIRNNVKKQVSFKDDSELCTIHPMVQWGYAYHSARCGPWEQLARDRARFEARIRKTEETLSKVLSPRHRDKIYKERFEDITTP